MLHGERNRTAAGPDIEDPRRIDALEEREAPFDDRLRLWSRHECARVGQQRQPPEVPVAEHIGERLTSPPPLDELAGCGTLDLTQGSIVLGVQLHASEAEGACEQTLGIEARMLDAPRREILGRAAEDFGEGHPSSARRCSSAVSASVKSSSEPASTCSSATLTFTRWSVTRLCGKL